MLTRTSRRTIRPRYDDAFPASDPNRRAFAFCLRDEVNGGRRRLASIARGDQTDRMRAAHRQGDYRVRFDWGESGAAAVAGDADVVVVVDVLSFTTTLSVAVDAGIAVYPYPCNDDSAERFADEQGAVLAVPRSCSRPGQISLSPASVHAAAVRPQRLVLPSPNGSALARILDRATATCVGASLRDTSAVAAWLAARHDRERATIAVLAAGERWDGGTLRPAVEDLWGAGAVISELADSGWQSRSPEADLARAGYHAVRGRELDSLCACASGRELIERGYAIDVAIAAETASSPAVPVLTNGRFVPAHRTD
jgi:2-phosphosulfolactate phosphatase